MKIDTLIPIYLLEDKNELPNNDFEVECPENSNYYIIASNGYFLRKSMGLFTKTIKVDSIPFLEELENENEIKFNLSPINAELCKKVKCFFTKVVDKHKSESCVILYYNRDTKEYAIAISQQAVSHSRVAYRIDGFASELNGFVPVGTIHSHCDFQAFHSNVDDRDEIYWDGIHITFGDNHLDEFTISASLIVQGERLILDPMRLIQGIDHVKHDQYSLIDKELNDYEKDEVESWMTQIVSNEEFVQGLAQ